MFESEGSFQEPTNSLSAMADSYFKADDEAIADWAKKIKTSESKIQNFKKDLASIQVLHTFNARLFVFQCQQPGLPHRALSCGLLRSLFHLGLNAHCQTSFARVSCSQGLGTRFNFAISVKLCK